MVSRRDLTPDALLAMARDRSTERRRELAQIMVDLFRDQGSKLGQDERAMMIDILRQLLGEVEVEVRRTLAEQLAKDPSVPRDLALHLANDTIEVAWPILKECHVLEDADLVEVVHLRSLEHRLIIAQRHQVSEAVADALVKCGEDNVIVTLLNNSNACLGPATMQLLAERSRDTNSFQVPLLRRNELTPALAKRMFLWVSAALRDHIVTRFRLDPAVIDELLEGVVAQRLAEPLPPSTDAYMIEQMERAGIILPSMLHEALTAGQVSLYARIAEKLTGVRSQLATRLLFDPSGEGLAVLCRSVELPKPRFLDMYGIARKARPLDGQMFARDLERLTEFYEAITVEAARAVVARWRRTSDYLAVLRAIEMAKGGSHE